MKQIFLFCALVPIFLSACNPFTLTKQVTGEQGLDRLANKTPILLKNFRKVDPSEPLEQTIGDVTVRIKHFYINQNMIAIGFIAESASGKRYDPGKMAITAPSTAPLKMTIGTSLNGSSADLGITLPPGESIFIFFFGDSNSPIIRFPFTGVFDLSLREFNLLREITKMGHEQDVGPFQFQFSLPGQ